MAARNISGVTKLEKAVPRHSLRKMRASRSTTRSMAGACILGSVLEGAPGEQEEHVLESAAAHQHRLGMDAVAADARHGGVAIGRGHEDAGGEPVDGVRGMVG